MKINRFPSFRDKSGVCLLRPSAAVLRKFLGCCFFVFLFPLPSFFFTFPLFLIPFSEDSFPRERPSDVLACRDSWNALLFFFLSHPPNINVKAFRLSFPLDLLLFALYSVCNGIMLYAHCPHVGPENPDVCMYPWAVGMNNSSRCSTVPVGRFHTFYLFLTDYSVAVFPLFPTLFLTVPSFLCLLL